MRFERVRKSQRDLENLRETWKISEILGKSKRNSDEADKADKLDEADKLDKADELEEG